MSFSIKKETIMLNETCDIISRIISIINQKSTLCTNKILVICFCPNQVNVLHENVNFYIFLLWGDCPSLPPPQPRCLWECPYFSPVFFKKYFKCIIKIVEIHFKNYKQGPHSLQKLYLFGFCKAFYYKISDNKNAKGNS